MARWFRVALRVAGPLGSGPGRRAGRPAAARANPDADRPGPRGYLRLVGTHDPGWEGRRHFFGAAARAMRDILVEQARRKAARKHGGGAHRVELTEGLAIIEPLAEDVLAVDEAI